jgi:hypothetical protein
LTINSSDTSFSKATQVDYAVPASKISALPSGEFVGMVADNPEQKIALKMFHSAIQNDHEMMAKEEAAFKPIPVVSYVSEETVQETYNQIKEEIAELFKKELAILDNGNEIEKTDLLKLNATKPSKQSPNKKQRRQESKRNRRRERENIKRLKQTTGASSGHYKKAMTSFKNAKTGQTLSM